ncbi:hypothetical protein [Mycolicibacterium sp. BK634]|uniref:hypothetical protein n=1 Tax=Mycolicibacterium sp. BK634 TaxID=2587099 RepID=UPI001C8479FC|nr:hypothetical protein [Mycolicibacterium sp. BK634]
MTESSEQLIDLRAIRHASDRSIQEIADEFGHAHRKKVTQMELRNDWLLSTVAKFIAAAGGTATLTVEINGQTLEFPLVPLA